MRMFVFVLCLRVYGRICACVRVCNRSHSANTLPTQNCSEYTHQVHTTTVTIYFTPQRHVGSCQMIIEDDLRDKTVFTGFCIGNFYQTVTI